MYYNGKCRLSVGTKPEAPVKVHFSNSLQGHDLYVHSHKLACRQRLHGIRSRHYSLAISLTLLYINLWGIVGLYEG